MEGSTGRWINRCADKKTYTYQIMQIDQQTNWQVGRKEAIRKTDILGDREIIRYIDRQRERKIHKQGTGTQIERERERQTQRKTDRQIDRQTDRQIDRQIGRYTDGWMDGWMDG